MFARIFLGCILILTFLILFPYIQGIWTDNDSGLNSVMANITNMDGTPAVSEMELSFWGIFPLLLLIGGVLGFGWLIVKDRG